MASADERRRPAATAWVSLGAWTGLVLAGARSAVLWAMEVVAHGSDPDWARLRMGSALPGAFLLSVACALIAAAVLSRFAAGGARNQALRLLFVLAAAYAFANVLLGWWGADVSRRVGLDTSTGRIAAGVLAGAALVLAAALAFGLALCARRRGAGASESLRPWLPLGLALLVPATWSLFFSGIDERMLIRRVASDIVAVEGWTEVHGREDVAPTRAVLCPSTLLGVDGADMPALVMPPPARVRVTVPPTARTSFLIARAGIDHSVWRDHGDRLAGHAIRFTVSRNGVRVHELTMPIEAEGRWGDVAGPGGFFVTGKDEVDFETALVSPDGAEVEPPEHLSAGFGGLRLEERRNRDRVRSTPERPNVVLIVMDTQRTDRMSCYGYERETTPNIDALAERGLVFDNAHATSSWTWPSTASILTGLHPQEHGVLDAHSCYLSHTVDTLAEALQQTGFTTAAWSANPLIVPDRNFDQGFEFFDAATDGGMRRSDVLVPAVLEWLGVFAEWRFFLYLHLVDPHAPLSPLPAGRELLAPDVPAAFDPRAITEYNWRLLAGEGHTPDGGVATERVVSPEHQRWIDDLYDACVWSGDHWVGRVLTRLAELELDEKTIVVITSDHGEELFDHGLGTHGYTLFGELTSVPLIVAGPGVPRGRVASAVSNRHLAPTLARVGETELVRLEDGVDLLGGLQEPRDVFFSTTTGWWNGHHPETILGLRRGTEVLHFAPEGSPWGSRAPAADGQERLYDVATDPEEMHDVSAERPRQTQAMRAAILELVEELESRRRAPRIEAGEATLERLRDLGYVGD